MTEHSVGRRATTLAELHETTGMLVPAQAFVAQMLASFLEFPPRQEAATFGITQALDKLRAGLPGA